MNNSNSYVVIYFDADKKSRQVIHPSATFLKAPNWMALVHAVTYGKYHSFEIR